LKKGEKSKIDGQLRAKVVIVTTLQKGGRREKKKKISR